MLTQLVEIKGHFIDSLLLAKILDQILSYGGGFDIVKMDIGERRTEPSHAQIRVRAPKREILDAILSQIQGQGAEVVNESDLAPEKGTKKG